MNLTIAPTFGKRSTPDPRHICRLLAAISCIVFLTSVSVHADQVRVNNVVQTLSNLQGTTNLQLTLVSQDPGTSGAKGSTVTPSGPRNDNASGTRDPKLDGVLPGLPLISDNNKIGIDDISEEGEVEGTICDCGEVLVAGGGFPMWPLAFLAAVPIAFIDFDDDCSDCNESTPTPTPTPSPSPNSTPTPTPEPASLLIFGTGLIAVGAGLRRRYTKAKLANQIQKTEEE